MATAATDGLPKQFVDSMHVLFNILDEKQTGQISIIDIQTRWQEGKVSGLPSGVLSALHKVTPASGLINFDRFVAGLRIALLRTRHGKQQLTDNHPQQPDVIAAHKSSGYQATAAVQPNNAMAKHHSDSSLSDAHAADGSETTGYSGSGTAYGGNNRDKHVGGRHTWHIERRSSPAPHHRTRSATDSKTLWSAPSSTSDLHRPSAKDRQAHPPSVSSSGHPALATGFSYKSNMGPPTDPPPYRPPSTQPSPPLPPPRVKEEKHPSGRSARGGKTCVSRDSQTVGDPSHGGSSGNMKVGDCGGTFVRNGMGAPDIFGGERSSSSSLEMPPPNPTMMGRHSRGATPINELDDTQPKSQLKNPPSYDRTVENYTKTQEIMRSEVCHPRNLHLTKKNTNLGYGNASESQENSRKVPSGYIDARGTYDNGRMSATVAPRTEGLKLADSSGGYGEAARHRKPHRRPRDQQRRHTLGSGVDHNMVRRIKQLEDERDTLLQGMQCAQDALEWYRKQLNTINTKLKHADLNDFSVESNHERVKLQGARIKEINNQLKALVDSSLKGLPLHMNLAMTQGQSSRTTDGRKATVAQREEMEALENKVAMLKAHNKLLTQELNQKTERMSQVEREKSSLIRELFDAKTDRGGKRHDDTTFM